MRTEVMPTLALSSLVRSVPHYNFMVSRFQSSQQDQAEAEAEAEDLAQRPSPRVSAALKEKIRE